MSRRTSLPMSALATPPRPHRRGGAFIGKQRAPLGAGVAPHPPGPPSPQGIERPLPPAARRRCLLAALPLAGALASCGFRLRGTQTLAFDSVFIEAPAASPIALELANAIRSGTGTAVVTNRAQARAVVQIVSEARERDVLSVDAEGRAREFRSRLRVVFRVTDGKAREFLGPTAINAFRDLAAREEQLLAREYEEAQLYQDMLVDVAQQMLRRLAALRI